MSEEKKPKLYTERMGKIEIHTKKAPNPEFDKLIENAYMMRDHGKKPWRGFFHLPTS